MRFASKVLTIVIGVALCAPALAQQKVNPQTGIAWPPNCEVYNVAMAACPPAGAIVFKGTWSSTTTYLTNQAVYYMGSQYVSLVNNNLNQTPSSSPLEWALLVSGGGSSPAGVFTDVQILGSDGEFAADSGNFQENATTHTLSIPNFNLTSTFFQNCMNPYYNVPASTIFTCQFFMGSNSVIPNVGQSGSASIVGNVTYNITSPGSNPGTNGAINDFQETGGGGPLYTSNITQRGNHSGGGAVINCYAIGDCQGWNVQALSPASGTQGADEVLAALRAQASQLSATTTGTITSGGTTGSTDLRTTVTFGNSQNYTDQGYMFDRSKPTGTAVVTGQAYNSGLNIIVQTVSGISLTPSTAWGQMQQSTVTYAPVGGQPVGLYQQYTSTTAVIVLGTSPASPGIFTTGAMTCSGIASEYMQVTAVSAINVPASGEQTITFLTRNGWDNTNSETTMNAACFQGGSLTSQAFLKSSMLDYFTIAYPIVGVISPTELAASNCYLGNCNQVENLLEINTPITFFPMAEVIGTDLGTPGAAQLGFNSSAWANGDTVTSALPEPTSVSGVHLNMSNSTPRAPHTVNTLIQNQGYGYGAFETGAQPTDIYFYGAAGIDPTNNSYALVGSQGSFQNGVIMYDAVPSGGCLACMVFARPEGASFIASAAGNQLTVTAMTSGYILPSQDLIDGSIPSGCLIQSYTPGSGTKGGTGTYTLTCSVSTITSQAMTTTRGRYFITGSLGDAGVNWSYDATTLQSVMNVAGGAGALNVAAAVQLQSLDSTPIGATTPSTGAFTTLQATSMDSTPIGSTTPSTGKFTTLNVSTVTASSAVCTDGSHNLTACAAPVVNYGAVTLVGGTATVTTALAESGAVILLTTCAIGGTQGLLSVGTITGGTSFVVNSSSALDISNVCWTLPGYTDGMSFAKMLRAARLKKAALKKAQAKVISGAVKHKKATVIVKKKAAK